MSDCIVGDGYDLNGYKARKRAGKISYLHRVEWEKENGPIPEGVFIDHTCRNRACVNLEHLRLVTPQVNSIENSSGATARNAAKTHCVRGHALPEKRDARGQRICKECKRIFNRTVESRALARERNRRFYAKKRAATAVLFGG